MKLAHARPGDTLKRCDDDGWHVIRIVAAFAESGPDGGSIRMVDYTVEDGADGVQRVRADTDPHDWTRVDDETDARREFAALGVSLPPTPPDLTEGQMLRAAADALGVRMPTRIPGDDQPTPAGVSVRVIGAAGGRRNARPRGRR